MADLGTHALNPYAGVLKALGVIATLPFGLLATYFLFNEFYRYSYRIKHMPGPWGWPIVGNLFQVTTVAMILHVERVF